jgi:predicted TIM-barrel enzyme
MKKNSSPIIEFTISLIKNSRIDKSVTKFCNNLHSCLIGINVLHNLFNINAQIKVSIKTPFLRVNLFQVSNRFSDNYTIEN